MSTKKYKMLFVLEHFYPYIGGAETLFYQLTTGLVASGIEVVVLTTKHATELLDSEEIHGVQVRRVNCISRFSFTYSAIPSAIRLAKDVDLIHTSSYTAALPARIAAFYTKTPLSITFHELWSTLWFRLPYLTKVQKYLYYSFEQLIISLSYKKIVAVSNYTHKALATRKPKADIVRIYNGIDYQEYNGLTWSPKAEFNALYLGRLGVSKGLDILIDSLGPFLEEFSDATVKIVIPEVPKKLSLEIRSKLEELNFASRIVVLSSLPYSDLLGHMIQSSCIVIPSYSEGFGYVGVETAAMGIPVISSNQGALSETISGEHLIMHEMSSKALTDALKKSYLKQWDYRDPIKFRLEDTIQNYLLLFNEMLDEK